MQFYTKFCYGFCIGVMQGLFRTKPRFTEDQFNDVGLAYGFMSGTLVFIFIFFVCAIQIVHFIFGK